MLWRARSSDACAILTFPEERRKCSKPVESPM